MAFKTVTTSQITTSKHAILSAAYDFKIGINAVNFLNSNCRVLREPKESLALKFRMGKLSHVSGFFRVWIKKLIAPCSFSLSFGLGGFYNFRPHKRNENWIFFVNSPSPVLTRILIPRAETIFSLTG